MSSENNVPNEDPNQPLMTRHAKTKPIQKTLEASFRFKNLNTDTADQLVSRLSSLTALDLSNNRLELFPRTIPLSIIAIDLSYNLFVDLPITRRLDNLVELRLRGNHIKKTNQLAFFTSLKYLDLSYNELNRVEGLEPLSQLQLLNLEANKIATPLAVRPLSVNKLLTTLILRDNPFAESQQYKTVILNTIPSVVNLDGKILPQRRKLAADVYRNGYVELFDASKYSAEGQGNELPEATITDFKATRMSQGLSSTINADSIYYYYDGSDIVPAVYNDEDAGFAVKPSTLPWRNPPNPMPRQLKGKPVIGNVVSSVPSPPSNHQQQLQSHQHHQHQQHQANGIQPRLTQQSQMMTFQLNSQSLGHTNKSQRAQEVHNQSMNQQNRKSSFVSESTRTPMKAPPMSSLHLIPSSNSKAANQSVGTMNGKETSPGYSQAGETTATSNISRFVEHGRPVPSQTDGSRASSTGRVGQSTRPSQAVSQTYSRQHQQQQPQPAPSLREVLKQSKRASGLYGVNAFSPTTGAKDKEPVRWMTPELSRRPTRENRKQEKAISEMMQRIGLPEEINKESLFWSNRAKSPTVRVASARAVSTGRATPTAKSSSNPPISGNSRSVSFNGDRPAEHMSQQHNQMPPSRYDQQMSGEMDDRSMSVSEISQRTSYQDFLMRQHLQQQQAASMHIDPALLPMLPTEQQQQYFQQQLHFQRLQPHFHVSPHPPFPTGRVPVPQYASSTSHQPEELPMNAYQGVPPPPPPPPPPVGPRPQHANPASITSVSTPMMPPHASLDLSPLGNSSGLTAAVNDVADEDVSGLQRDPVRELFQDMYSTGATGALPAPIQTPITIEGCHIASAIGDLMTRKQKTLELIHAAKSRSFGAPGQQQ